MADGPDRQWTDGTAAIPAARTVWSVQLADRWLVDPTYAPVRDALDLAIGRRLLGDPRGIAVRRLLHYDPPSDLGGVDGYARVKAEHESWLARIRRQLVYVGAS